jgi:ribose transport system ATP-binding protein
LIRPASRTGQAIRWLSTRGGFDRRAGRLRNPTDAIRHGLGLLTRDRRQGLVPALPVAPNISLANISQLPLPSPLRLRAENRVAAEYVRSLRIQCPRPKRPVMYLSGGNQQKVLLARWLASRARVLLFDEPTRGIDVGSKAEVFALMNRLTGSGVGILMISSEMPEILAMADRIPVARRAGNRRAGGRSGHQASVAALGKLKRRRHESK